MAAQNTPTRLLDTAQVLVQTRGYNAFSYKDLAEAVGIRTASIHYHFPSKGDLGKALMERYLARLEEGLEVLDTYADSARDRLLRFVDLYRRTENQGAICLCGSMAADLATLPEEVHTVVRAYIERSRAWLARTIEAGVDAGEFTSTLPADQLAATLLASLQGALVLGRAIEGDSILDSVQHTFLATLTP